MRGRLTSGSLRWMGMGFTTFPVQKILFIQYYHKNSKTKSKFYESNNGHRFSKVVI